MFIVITSLTITKVWNDFYMKWILWLGTRNKTEGAPLKKASLIIRKNFRIMHIYSKPIMTIGKIRSGIH